MRRAFTLVEVLVAVTIISVVVIGLLSSNATNAKLSKKLSNQYRHKEQFSIVLLNANERFHNREKSLYDFLATKFNIKNDELRRWLKEQKVSYIDKDFATVKILDLDTQDFGGYDKSLVPDLAFSIQEVKAYNKNSISIGYTFNLQ